ncbi:alpha/beta fold hydrolase [Nocardia sp. NEAU-G5]|uniref:Alpha/beta fold hydrolase n=1 Tax=Nocardia albiluteola TaxID=2842303 RepID=A0ABS6B6Y9_9NOCA|nr:alpha/beta fold hydrolase [Nocardia albiluteola]MBU3065171.1 alpha/beta fold hydrolase [Nocardia albiluteola]
MGQRGARAVRGRSQQGSRARGPARPGPRGSVDPRAGWQRFARPWVAAAVLAGTLTLGVGAPASAQPSGYPSAVIPTQPGPPQPEHLGASRYQKLHPNAAPAGANDFGCRPRAEHPRPVILAHGTDATAYSDWSAIGPQLARAGFCVFALNYGGKPGATSFGTEELRTSSRQIGDFVHRVLAATGARRVDLVGFSQGANVTRYYINKLGGARKVRNWVGLASPTYGGVMFGLVPLADTLPGLWPFYRDFTSLAAVEQAQGAPFMRELNAGGDTVPGVHYTTIGSRVDEVIQPFSNIALRGPGARNLVLQDLCPADLTGHFHMVYDPYVQQLLRNVLDPRGARPAECREVPLGEGIPDVVLGAHS